VTVEQGLTIVGIVASAIMVGIGGAMAWFRSQRTELTADLNELRGEMRSQIDDMHINDRDIAVMKTEIRNNVERLEEINDSTKQTNHKLDKLADTLTTLLIAVKSK